MYSESYLTKKKWGYRRSVLIKYNDTFKRRTVTSNKIHCRNFFQVFLLCMMENFRVGEVKGRLLIAQETKRVTNMKNRTHNKQTLSRLRLT